MNIQMDKKYRTRGGRDVRILCTDAKSPKDPYPVVGWYAGINKDTGRPMVTLNPKTSLNGKGTCYEYVRKIQFIDN